MRVHLRLLFAGLVVLLSTPAALAAALVISGEVTYLERIALPPAGTLRISLVDMQTPDQPRIQAEGVIASPGQVPLTFRFNLDDKVIAADRVYGLRAEILSAGTVWFRNDTPVVIDLAATEGLKVLVAASGVATPAAVQPVVDPAPLLDVTWTAVAIAGVPVEAEQSTISIAADRRAGGRGACNSYFSQATIEGDRLAFSPPAATRMACSEALMAQEAVFFDALANTRHWRLVDTTLELLDAQGVVRLQLVRSTR